MVYDPTINNGRKNKEYSKGYLIEATENSMIETPFNYRTLKPRSFQVTNSVMPLEYIVPTENIFTSRIDLGFAEGKKIKMQDGRKMTIENADYTYDDNKAFFDGDGRTGWNITLKGGG